MKKNQHYVFRDYLRPWADGEYINATRNGSTFKANLTGVAQQRFFYKLSDLTNEDVKFIFDFAIKPLESDLAEINIAWLEKFTAPQKIKEFLIKEGLYNKNAQEKIDNIYKSFGEELHSSIESKGIPIIKMLKKNDLSFYDDNNKRASFCHFLCVQYFRTKKIKDGMLLLAEKKIYLERVWNILSHIYATNVGRSIYLEKYKFILLSNETKKYFITSDQPVINLLAEEAKKPDQYDIELYYPTSPKTALLVTNNKNYDNKSLINLDVHEVNKLNDKIREFSSEFIFNK
ncbi:DUF4238 domain-containing protein [Pantoea ananatis]|uniref:DUF4238 domain-containing protein n=1 Tax=Pantoea ananas TaxID=553 RepID=UPI001B31183C|nr:DUF4238 domain-containing protein [Pantoea ananatis]